MPPLFTELLDNFPRPAFQKKVRGKYHYEENQSEELKVTALEMLPFLRQEAFWQSAPMVQNGVSLHRQFTQGDSGNIGAYRKDSPEEPGVDRLHRKDVPEEPGVVGPCRKTASESKEARYERVVISLGPGIDILQEQYGEKGFLSKSYMLEALASELLLESYGAYNRYAAETTDYHVARYHFPESEAAYPLERMPELLAGLTERVSCNAAFCLLPKKSVVFVAELTRDETVQCEGICMGCGNVRCINRIGITDAFGWRRRMAKMTDMPLNYGYSRIFGK